MIRKYVLPLIAIGGFLFAIYIVRAENRPVKVAAPLATPSASPYESFIAGSGLVESASENIEISSPIPGLVKEVFVHVGEHVAKGAPLFQLDDRSVRAQIGVQEALLASAQAKRQKFQMLPRPEDIPIAEAAVRDAETNLADLKEQFELRQKISDKRAISQDEMSRRRFAIIQAASKVSSAQAQLAELKAGSWAPDLAIADAEVMQAEATLRAAHADLDRLTVRAPSNGECLQVKIHAGEYAAAGPTGTPLILFGDTNKLRIRIQIDENDAWRAKPNARAVAYTRGNHGLNVELAFVRFEPYIVPKSSLTGESTERVDTRVLQVLYEFDRKDLPVFPGQQMDVYIEAPSAQ
jgi:multidrug resistance efflux pump